MAQNDINTTYGSALIGLVVGAVLYGLTLLQTYIYYRRYPNDSWKLKTLVGVLWVADTLHLILCTTSVYWYLVLNFNNPAQLGFTHWSMNLQIDCNGLIGFSVELFFAQRVWRLSKSYLLTGFITILAFLHFALGVYFTVEAFLLKEYSKYARLTWVTSTGLGGAAAADIVIAGALCYYLSQSRTGFERTDSMITKLMVYAINTGLLTSICATAAVILFATMPLNFIWLSFFWILGKLYVNSLLASLNSRASLRETGHPQDATFVQLSKMKTDSVIPSSPLARRNPHIAQLAITVETTKEQQSDYYEVEDVGSPSTSQKDQRI